MITFINVVIAPWLSGKSMCCGLCDRFWVWFFTRDFSILPRRATSSHWAISGEAPSRQNDGNHCGGGGAARTPRRRGGWKVHLGFTRKDNTVYGRVHTDTRTRTGIITWDILSVRPRARYRLLLYMQPILFPDYRRTVFSSIQESTAWKRAFGAVWGRREKKENLILTD